MNWEYIRKKGKNLFKHFVGDVELIAASEIMKFIPNYEGINLYKINDSYYLDILKKIY
ncbi:hypothetical protein K9L67_05175 [Candidatus Woesearchaeota archaeon]|nr:hypothetical protein [Candidatus Woesearchaeota archaeon]MCF7901590.1 hypothetical protein [Candidatus Woesearchaeota archaeon]MCF8013645.1 hypothetical protein [Candidatus Woesearchaeota archaeon]